VILIFDGCRVPSKALDSHRNQTAMQDLTENQATPPDEWVTLTTRSAVFSAISEINDLRLWLETNGVEVFLPDEITAGMDPLRLYAMGGMRLQVPKSQIQNAHTLMKEWEASHDSVKNAITEDSPEWQTPLPQTPQPAPNVFCPYCHSSNVVYMQDSCLRELFYFLFLGFFYLYHVNQYGRRLECRDCRLTWRERERLSL